MNTKLKTLLLYLTKINVDKEILDKLLLNNYFDENNSEYIVDGTSYIILTDIEICDDLLQKAEEYAYDIQYNFENELEGNIHIENLRQAVKCLNVDDLTDVIYSDLCYESVFGQEKVHDDENYTIFI